MIQHLSKKAPTILETEGNPGDFSYEQIRKSTKGHWRGGEGLFAKSLVFESNVKFERTLVFHPSLCFPNPILLAAYSKVSQSKRKKSYSTWLGLAKDLALAQNTPFHNVCLALLSYDTTENTF